ncbi:PEP-CTERM sorting domain-containing protein, partial [bacterium]|nr:PEP-CTERM sorting domain-containing protein [bacterium]
AAGGPTSTLASAPSGWSFLGSTAANGGTETALTAGQVGNQSAAYQGFVGSSTAGTAAVYGTNTADPAQFEIFSNGDANGGVVGTDLLLHSGQGGNADEFVIVRFTVGDDSLFTAGTGTISGSFRELVVGGGAAAQSVAVSVYQNSTSLFSVAGGTTAQGTPNILEQADGTFNLTGLTLATGDTIDFVVGQNGHFGADEIALQASIGVDTIPEPSTALLGGLGLLGLLRRRR